MSGPVHGAVAMLDAAMAPIDPTSLEDVLTAAELTTRVDRKYVVSTDMFTAAVAAVAPALAVLEIDEQRSFHYETVYFDTPSLQSFLGAAHGRRRRFKVRTRTYLDSQRCLLEVKQTGGRGETIKVARDYEPGDRFRLTPEALAFISEHVTVGLDGPLRPVVTTRYVRSTLVDYADDARITCDADLRLGGVDGEAEIVLDDAVVVETKSTGVTTEMDRFLWRQGCRPLAISKFSAGMAMLHPELPANKWHRTLQRCFGRGTRGISPVN